MEEHRQLIVDSGVALDPSDEVRDVGVDIRTFSLLSLAVFSCNEVLIEK